MGACAIRVVKRKQDRTGCSSSSVQSVAVRWKTLDPQTNTLSSFHNLSKKSSGWRPFYMSCLAFDLKNPKELSFDTTWNIEVYFASSLSLSINEPNPSYLTCIWLRWELLCTFCHDSTVFSRAKRTALRSKKSKSRLGSIEMQSPHLLTTRVYVMSATQGNITGSIALQKIGIVVVWRRIKVSRKERIYGRESSSARNRNLTVPLLHTATYGIEMFDSL